ncbi:hypothetical protein WH7805_00400 [Synechococcus sp. WH 7805]|nr:hypothetical protein WH7805_00400 [Synechococcus sp. WH 7805]
MRSKNLITGAPLSVAAIASGVISRFMWLGRLMASGCPRWGFKL